MANYSRRKKSIQPLPRLLSSKSKALAGVAEKLHQLQRLNSALQTHLDEPLKTHCQVANWQHQELVLLVDSSIWATRLRYQLNDIQYYLQKRCQITINQIKIKISLVTKAPEQAKRRLVLSEQNAEYISELAAGIEDEALQQALQRIAAHATDKAHY